MKFTPLRALLTPFFIRADDPYIGSRYRGSTGGLRDRKRETHEGGIRVPTILSWPNGLAAADIAPGSISAEPIIGSDIFPTMHQPEGNPRDSFRRKPTRARATIPTSQGAEAGSGTRVVAGRDVSRM